MVFNWGLLIILVFLLEVGKSLDRGLNYFKFILEEGYDILIIIIFIILLKYFFLKFLLGKLYK